MREAREFDALGHAGPGGNSGLLWAINRLALHPLGYALALHYLAACPDCSAERTDYEWEGGREGTHLPQCPSCQSEADPVVKTYGWSLAGDGSQCFTFSEAEDDEGFRLFHEFLSTLPSESEEESDATD